MLELRVKWRHEQWRFWIIELIFSPCSQINYSPVTFAAASNSAMRRSTKSCDGDIAEPGLGGRRTECEKRTYERQRIRRESEEKERNREKGGREERRGRERERAERWCWPLHRERGGWSHLSRSRWSDATDNEKETPPRPGPAWRTRTELVRSRLFLDAVCPPKLCQTSAESSSAMHHARFCHRRWDKRRVHP